MYKLSVISMFKNESDILECWLNHYLKEGVEHFYLIDNGSTDNYNIILEKFKNLITLVSDNFRSNQPGTQNILLNKHFKTKIKKESEWVLICDMDEYVYNNEDYKNIPDFLEEVNINISQIKLPWKIFGSNKCVKIPSNIIQSLTKRQAKQNLSDGYSKTISRTKDIINLETHKCKVNGLCVYSNLSEEYNDDIKLELNHYMLISEDYYRNIKCTRGGGQSNFSIKYTMDYFYKNDINFNELDDIGLSIKNYK
ncbi:hypothetical protein crov269 [Cafeteria roenbergensis virus]|uniref:Glycosyltransferase family 2 protein n=1 Tax=Cafeteria roenbergensis virus (strain BV-PW1) TaxID=693272 RepID=E3T539_CROVB|nr:hypothetical protein crov269 [Cafeteria roenbergensis virus BV-PW1]ADO67302.1 hypothetical protein crov269 [Cafeteria roenbergensis virus BV-PW1]